MDRTSPVRTGSIEVGIVPVVKLEAGTDAALVSAALLVTEWCSRVGSVCRVKGGG